MDNSGVDKIVLSTKMHLRFKELLIISIAFNTGGQPKAQLEPIVNSVSIEKIQVILKVMNDRDKGILLSYISGKSQRVIAEELGITAKKVGDILNNWVGAIYTYLIDNDMSAMKQLNTNWADYHFAKADMATRFKIAETFIKSLFTSGLISEDLATLLINYYSQVLRLGTNTRGNIKKEQPAPMLTDEQYREFYFALVINLTDETRESYQPFILAVKEKAESLGARNQTNIKNVILGAYSKLIFLRPELQRIGTKIISDIEA